MPSERETKKAKGEQPINEEAVNGRGKGMNGGCGWKLES